MDAKARLVEVIGAALNDGWRHEAGRLADKVLAEFDLTPKPPQPAGPVTSEEAMIAYERAFQRVNAGAWFDPDTRVGRRVALDAAMPLLARDHGYVKLSEVERRAREWARQGYGVADHHWVASLVAALTREAK